MIRVLCALVGLRIGTIIQVIFSYCSVSRSLYTSLRHRKPRPSPFSGWIAQNERPCVFVRGSRSSGSRFLKSMEQSVRCSISHSLLLHAAHLCGKAAKGSDDWRNGLPLCATHHLAFDADLFAIDPNTLEIVLAGGLDRDSLGVQRTLATIRGRPHLDALRWRFEHFNKGGSAEPNPKSADPSAPLPHSKDEGQPSLS